jgi:acyloxyacyl hydrolase
MVMMMMMMMMMMRVGNDVCGAKNFSQMTSVAQFKANILYILQNVICALEYYLNNVCCLQLDAHLPKGSHVVTIGLADGEMLWTIMHNRTHPLGVKCAHDQSQILLMCVRV